VINSDNKKRIMFVAQAPGGVDRYLRSLLKYLDRSKYEIVMVCSQDFNREDYEKLSDYYECVTMNRAIGFNDFSATVKVRKLIENYKPDIVYAHSSKAGAIARLANLTKKCKCIYNPHGWAFNMKTSSFRKKLYLFTERFLARFCDLIICISEAEKRSALENRICEEDKLTVIYNGIDIVEYEEISKISVNKKDIGIPENTYVVGMVGRMSEQKAPDVFMKAMTMLKKEIPNLHIVIVGNGPLEAKVREYANNNGLEDSLTITGWVNDPAKYVKCFDMGMLLSRWEGFGLAIPEYMILKVPVIASATDGIENIVRNRENGILVAVDDYESAAKAVLEIKKDDRLRQYLVETAYEDVKKRFDVVRVAREHEDVLDRL